MHAAQHSYSYSSSSSSSRAAQLQQLQQQQGRLKAALAPGCSPVARVALPSTTKPHLLAQHAWLCPAPPRRTCLHSTRGSAQHHHAAPACTARAGYPAPPRRTCLHSTRGLPSTTTPHLLAQHARVTLHHHAAPACTARAGCPAPPRQSARVSAPR